jgi:hypothetical protein
VRRARESWAANPVAICGLGRRGRRGTKLVNVAIRDESCPWIAAVNMAKKNRCISSHMSSRAM